MTLQMVVSGGQNGADIAGWKAAKACGIPTTGWMPAGFMTLDGPRPEYAELYGAKEHASPDYGPRTDANVRDSDGTFLMACDPHSYGIRRTRKALDTYWDRFHLGLPIYMHGPKEVELVADWIIGNEIGVLNVAGNSERPRRAKMEPVVYDFLCRVFERLGFPRKEL